MKTKTYLGKGILLGLIVILALATTACGSSAADDPSYIKVYQNESKLNSDVNNVWQKIFLLDDSTYLFTVYAVDSADTSKVTADFSMKGHYTRTDNQIDIDLGYGYVIALNGDTPISMAITPEGGAMYYAMIGGQYTSFILEDDGHFTIVK